uniref:Uncharacterized protein n=1 Tax=Ascaris lumbricoides TaxID=6252 RepID=A0A0M3HP11_ASCLU
MDEYNKCSKHFKDERITNATTKSNFDECLSGASHLQVHSFYVSFIYVQQFEHRFDLTQNGSDRDIDPPTHDRYVNVTASSPIHLLY